MQGWSVVEPLNRTHDLQSFDCGRHESLNLWLKRHALQNQSSDSARTYIVHRENTVVGFYSISAGSIAKLDAPGRIAQGIPNHPIPISLIGRLAVDRHEQGLGLGKALLKDALLRISNAADIFGIRAVLIHAIDHEARSFYKKYGFDPCPQDELHLMLLMKDLRELLPNP